MPACPRSLKATPRARREESRTTNGYRQYGPIAPTARSRSTPPPSIVVSIDRRSPDMRQDQEASAQQSVQASIRIKRNLHCAAWSRSIVRGARPWAASSPFIGALPETMDREPGDYDEPQADAQPAKITADVFRYERGDKSETACRSHATRHEEDTTPTRIRRTMRLTRSPRSASCYRSSDGCTARGRIHRSIVATRVACDVAGVLSPHLFGLILRAADLCTGKSGMRLRTQSRSLLR